ncbi:hypothetical protein I553_6662 [Mycobacterium xenopi 4042]|uniref:Uncharacterized protein n=1 Tax=Mycobacterium xenopi 4042 TaxID=1299334 RepID=X7ZZH1_MYCXE|nr:hypothetical protein I553_6662 [Mycobacterium xenopi 4042]
MSAMTIDPEQIRAEINALLAGLPDLDDDEKLAEADLDEIAAVCPKRTTCWYARWSRRRRAERRHAAACPH